MLYYDYEMGAGQHWQDAGVVLCPGCPVPAGSLVGCVFKQLYLADFFPSFIRRFCFVSCFKVALLLGSPCQSRRGHVARGDMTSVAAFHLKLAF